MDLNGLLSGTGFLTRSVLMQGERVRPEASGVPAVSSRPDDKTGDETRLRAWAAMATGRGTRLDRVV
jgi:hypothetical protein